MSHSENYNFEKEFQNFQQGQNTEGLKEKPVEAVNELDLKEIINREQSMFSKFRGKVKSIAKFLILMTALTFATKPKISPKGPISEKPKITIPEKKPDWHQDEKYQELVKKIAKDKTYALRDFINYHREPYAEEIISNLAQKDPDYFLEFGIDEIIEKPWSKEIIVDAYKRSNNVNAVIGNERCLSDAEWGRELCAGIYKEYPQYMTGFDDRLIEKFKKVKDPEFQTLLSIFEKLSAENLNYKKSRLFLFAKDITEGKLTIEEADKIASDKLTTINYFAKSPENLKKPGTMKELQSLSREFISIINAYHDEPDEKRFKSLNNMSAKGLYLLMISGRDELYTSSYNGAFDRLMEKMKNENIASGDQLMKEINYTGFRTFIEMASRYNRLNEFLETMSKDQQKDIMKKMIKGVGTEKDSLREAVVVADIFGTVKNPEFVEIFQQEIKNEYDNFKDNKEIKALYGLLASVLENYINSGDKWFLEMKKEYPMPESKKIFSYELFNQNLTNIQEYYFYNDEDGKLSYADFLNNYKNDKNWEIKDMGEYVKISSKKEGKKIEIFANKPEYDETGHKAIRKMLSKDGLIPDIIVHRGHSYHVEKTIKNITKGTKLVFLGSCGGYNQISNIIEKSNEAQIISTKGRGTGFINDPLLKMLNEEILSGKDIVWTDFWQKADIRFKNNPDFDNYIPPNRNQSLLFLRAYNHLTQ